MRLMSARNLYGLSRASFQENQKAKNAADVLAASLIAVGFIAFLILLATKANVSFDASYNLLSYQNLFEGKGFVYDYDGRHVPFDPAISTGPELYLPVFAIWKITGHTDYFVSVYLVIAYYALFLGFLVFYVLRTSETKTISMFAFVFLFVSNRKIFGGHFPVAPLGEFVVYVFIFMGIYFLHKRKLLTGFVLLGLAVDLKTSIIIALLPTVTLYWLLEFLIPKLRERKLKEVLRVTLAGLILSSLLFVPYLAYSKIIPSIVLSHEERKILKRTQRERFQLVKERGLGQIIALQKNLDREGFALFVSRTGRKVATLKSWFDGSYLLVSLFGILLVTLAVFSCYKKDYSFYLFIFSVFIAVWWLLCPADDWYRYFFLAEWMFSLGVVSLVPVLAKKENRVASVVISIAVIILFAPQFSLSSIKKNLNDTDRKDLMLMGNYIRNIDERNIFTYGWFQCPQLMFLTGKRFRDYTNENNFSQTREKGRERFLLTTAENAIAGEEMEGVIKKCELIKEYGDDRLYRIRHRSR
jgi:hypothetical protein